MGRFINLQLTKVRTEAQRAFVQSPTVEDCSLPLVLTEPKSVSLVAVVETSVTNDLSGSGLDGPSRAHSLSCKQKDLFSHSVWDMAKDQCYLAAAEARRGRRPVFSAVCLEQMGWRRWRLFVKGWTTDMKGKQGSCGLGTCADGGGRLMVFPVSSNLAQYVQNVRDGLICWRILQLP